MTTLFVGLSQAHLAATRARRQVGSGLRETGQGWDASRQCLTVAPASDVGDEASGAQAPGSTYQLIIAGEKGWHGLQKGMSGAPAGYVDDESGEAQAGVLLLPRCLCRLLQVCRC